MRRNQAAIGSMPARRLKAWMFVSLSIGPVLFAYTDSLGARAADIVNRTFVIRGARASELALLIGLPVDRSASLTLPWDSAAAIRNCSFGLSEAARERRCEDIAAPINTVVYRPAPSPELRLSGSWLDRSTGSGPPVPRFTFQSPVLTDNDTSDWSIVLRKTLIHRDELKDTAASEAREAPFIEIRAVERDEGRAVMFGIDEDDWRTRTAKMKRYSECREQGSRVEGGC